VITQEKLKELYHYDSLTGIFIRKKSGGGKKAGTIAGSLKTSGYIQLSIKDKLYYCHRLAWLYVYGVFPDNIDHINHDRSDNRIINLRDVARSENNRNMSVSKKNKSGFTGVCWSSRYKKWESTVMIDGRKIHLGYFTDKDKAINERMIANEKYGFHENHGIVL